MNDQRTEGRGCSTAYNTFKFFLEGNGIFLVLLSVLRMGDVEYFEVVVAIGAELDDFSPETFVRRVPAQKFIFEPWKGAFSRVMGDVHVVCSVE